MTHVKCSKENCYSNKNRICQESQIKIAGFTVSIQRKIIPECVTYAMNPHAKGYTSNGIKIS